MDTKALVPTPSSAARVRRRDQKTEHRMRALIRKAPHLNDPRFVPILRTFAYISNVLDRAYMRLETTDLINPKTGELRYSVDVLRRLAETHMMLARELKLSPRAGRIGVMDLAGAIADAKDER